MRATHVLRTLVAATCLGIAASSLAAIQLVPVVSSGLASPLFVGHAGDGSNRLFIVERGGIVKVLQPGASTPTVFLDISSRVLAGNERGLLGLAFHPQYETNGRFFVFYTRASNGDIVVAQYAVSTNPNVASTAETILMVIPHSSFANHNGGMLAFGPDGYLYIGVGDGGGANDPGNNAQNIDQLLGKILRIDVNTPGSYSSPSGNPYVGTAGRDEIFAVGMRNPWRFSFDRLTGQQWVADVGQDSREEVDTPIVAGGNYGWRVFEGEFCTGNGPLPCNRNNYIFPVFEYIQSGGRCSITGGYVYRGSAGAVTPGTYVYGDFCSGEIFGWDGTAQTVLLDTALNISSFGEDEAGELYVVNLGGSLMRIASTAPPCTYGIAPTSRSLGAGAGTGTVAVTAGTGCTWTASPNASWLQITSGASGSGNGGVGYSVAANTGSAPRTGTLTIAGQTFTVTQTGAAACTSSISPSSASYPAGGGAGNVSINTPAGCPWTAASNASWISLGTTSGNGPASVGYTVAPYTGKPKKRSGTVTIAGQTFSVQQTK